MMTVCVTAAGVIYCSGVNSITFVHDPEKKCIKQMSLKEAEKEGLVPTSETPGRVAKPSDIENYFNRIIPR